MRHPIYRETERVDTLEVSSRVREPGVCFEEIRGIEPLEGRVSRPYPSTACFPRRAQGFLIRLYSFYFEIVNLEKM